MDAWLLGLMACPRHQTALTAEPGGLTCAAGCRFPVVRGVPVMLLEEAAQTMDLARTSLDQARAPHAEDELYVDSLGLSDAEKQGIRRLASREGTGVDPVVSFLVGATNGLAYANQIGRLREYPIPTNLPAPSVRGQALLDVGCNWGRWSVAASRKGYKVVGIDPSLGAVIAATRVARQLGVDPAYVVGDARFLPFRAHAFDHVYSYSVLQHLSRDDVARAIAEVGRVLQDGGACRVQMPTKYGLRCLYHQMRRGFREGVGFEVRYWSLPALRELFVGRIGPTTISVDCFFGIGLQFSDVRFMTPPVQAVATVSEALRLMSRAFTPLTWAADSVFVSSVKAGIRARVAAR
jgi:SAM-dependent methyltransferase/uncharacterized protein YbaR (Trm112 family)